MRFRTIYICIPLTGAWGSVVCATSRTVSGSVPGGITGEFSAATDGTICPGVDSVPGISPGVKAAGA
jgi:hypothetical protein